MISIIKRIGRSIGRKSALVALSVAAIAGLGFAAPAHAGGRVDVDFDIRIGQRHCEPEHYERQVRVWVPAQYRTVTDRRWIEPVYDTRCEKVWVEPVYENRCERVWIPERHEYRQTRKYDRHCGRFVTVAERVCIPGRWEEQHRRVLVREGHWHEVHKKVCVREGRWETFTRQELVCEGHWETRTQVVHNHR